ncbi:MAG: UDP-N-acetylmuramate--L-alanine ligase [Bacilli bacterium]
MTYHFIGIKGTGMSALAHIYHDLGYQVQGSDVTEHLFTQDDLEKKKIKLLPFNRDNIHHDMQVIVGNAFDNNHVEVKRCHELKVKTQRYYEALNTVINNYKTIAVSGCHGKTTTTSLLAHLLNNIVGCNYLIGDGTGYMQRDNRYFVFEACEYKRIFLNYYPTYTIITNIELEHVDYYKDLNDVLSSFQTFVNQTKEIVLACGDDPSIRSLKYNQVKFYGFNDNNDIIARRVKLTSKGSNFDVYINNNLYGHFTLPLYGKHMILNALAVIGICHHEGLNSSEVSKQLKCFPGAKRRFKEKKIKDIVTIDDYAHHPTEIKVMIDAVRQKYPKREIVAVFKPNTYTRTKALATDFINALNLADKAYVTDIFCDREKKEDYPHITSSLIIDRLKNGDYISDDSVNKLLKHKKAVILFMSCKNIYTLREKYEALLKKD